MTQKPAHKRLFSRSQLGLIVCGLLSIPLSAIAASGAERIAFAYPPFGEFSLPTQSLEAFAKQGIIDDDFAFYAKRATPQQLAQLRELLQRRFAVSPVLVSQFTYSPLGQTVVQRLGEVLQTDTRQNGFYALRAALILAAADPDGLTVVNLLQRFPSQSVRLDLQRGFAIVGSLSDLLKRRDRLVMAIKQEATVESTQAPLTFAQQPDLRQAGPFQWQQKTLDLYDQTRVSKPLQVARHVIVDLYLPQLPNPTVSPSPAPVIVISHGVASDRQTFAYLAQHLASYGFAVAVMEHPGIDRQRFRQYFSGLAAPPDARESIDQPLDVKFALDELQKRSQSDPLLQGRLNLQQVGMIGHSMGGYTALTLAGATLNFEQLRQVCHPNNSLNLSLLVQCKTAELPPLNYPLRDDRIKAVLAINPVTSSLLGQQGLSQIKIPTLLIAGSEDVVAPAVPEQIRPFTWLTTAEKYLVLMEKGTHFSVLGNTPEQGALPVPAAMIGPDPAIARTYTNALSVAFFQTTLANRSDYRLYLSAAYAQSISQAPLGLSLVQAFTAKQFAEAAAQTTVPLTLSP